jgi:signal transduction histidine kinase
MVSSVSFQTRARTVDHLGREQIADCPTAISELWKNSYDAYAKNVELHIIDGDHPVATIFDDGHGMSREDFVNKWLVIGTESKKEKLDKTVEELNGLKPRAIQGQKGIGRLSSAIMGPLLLLVSKKKNEDYVACLIDWRLFENPYIYLHDIKIPIESFSKSSELTSLLPDMYNILMGNIWGSGNPEQTERDTRIESAWHAFEELEKKDNRTSTKEAIESTIIDSAFENEHFEKWDVWNGKSSHGTALFIGEINADLAAQLQSNDSPDNTVVQAQNKFMTTLTSFCERNVGKRNDIFGLDQKEVEKNIADTCFNYKVVTWQHGVPKIIISPELDFPSDDFDKNEHLFSGYVDQFGVFKGKVKAFSKDEVETVIEPPYTVSQHPKGKVGGFHITVASFEGLAQNTSLEPGVFQNISDMSNKYAGFLVYRDGLRVMPYGREDNDFFEIEHRRSRNAGLYHYSNRNIFGRIVITGNENSNLNDKAGREGFIDNKASKTFKDIVTNILSAISKRYIGRTSENRIELRPIFNEEHRTKKAKEAKDKKLKLSKKNFIKSLNTNQPLLHDISDKVSSLSINFENNAASYDVIELESINTKINEQKRELSKLRLTSVPANLDKLESNYREYSDSLAFSSSLLNSTQASISFLIEKINPKTPEQLVTERAESLTRALRKNLKLNYKDLQDKFNSELERINNVIKLREEYFQTEMENITSTVNNPNRKLQDILLELEHKKDQHDLDNDEIFTPYLSAIESLQNSIDIEAIALMNSDELEALEKENNRLNSLAQLGVTVEIIGHELDSLDNAMRQGMNSLPEEVKLLNPVKSIERTYDGISNKFKFLSPLKLSGITKKVTITGKEINDYTTNFFADLVKDNGINLEFTANFDAISFKDERSRIYPVFINLINNSRYWVCQKESSTRHILIDYKDGQVFISDDGPGVNKQDIKSLFTLFFTMKLTGGRGIGLYLCRANLAAGGHKIAYVKNEEEKLLSGANFVMTLKRVKG